MKIFFLSFIISLFIWSLFVDPHISNFQKIPNDDKIVKNEIYTRKAIYYNSIDEKNRLHAWFYVPNKINSSSFPVVIMGHGFAAQKDFKIPSFAEDFTKIGFAVFTFDYRSFGGSDGENRNIVSVEKHLEDWHSTVDYVIKNSKELQINPKQIVLWGSSFGGGHVLTIGATTPYKENIMGIISQVPFVDGIDSLLRLYYEFGVVPLLKTIAYSLKDHIRNAFSLSRQYIPLISQSKNEVRIFPTDESYKGYSDIIPSNPIGGWKNQVAAAIFFEFPLYRPITYADKITSKVLLIAGEDDSLCPIQGVKGVADKIPKENLTLHILKSNHFDPYVRYYDIVVKHEIDFLTKILK